MIICPATEPSCRIRYRNSSTTYQFSFTNIPTDASCPNGQLTYNFTLDGSTEFVDYGSRWSSGRESNLTGCIIRFIGPDTCGDRYCASSENCTTCEADCGRCPECSGNATACRNGSVMGCSGGFYTRLVQQCTHGCSELNNTPSCLRFCDEGDKRCADNMTLQECVNGDWQNQTCARACANSACITDMCYGISCPDKCDEGTAYSHGACDPSSGRCTYYSSVPCPYGCDGASCSETPLATPSPTPAPGPKPLCGAAFLLPLLLLLVIRRS